MRELGIWLCGLGAGLVIGIALQFRFSVIDRLVKHYDL